MLQRLISRYLWVRKSWSSSSGAGSGVGAGAGLKSSSSSAILLDAAMVGGMLVLGMMWKSMV